MASVEVFVDDAVRGRLPYVCAKTGVPADGKLRIRQTRGHVGPAVLLVFLGPVGWIALFTIAWFAGRFGELNVRLPYSQRAVDHETRLQHARLVAFVAGSLALLVALLSASARPRQRWLVCSQVSPSWPRVVGVVQHFRLDRVRVGVNARTLSRRWVTLTGVHPDFVRAVAARARSSSKTSASTPGPSRVSRTLASDPYRWGVRIDRSSRRRRHSSLDRHFVVDVSRLRVLIDESFWQCAV